MRKLFIFLCLILSIAVKSQTTGSFWKVTSWNTPFGQALPDSVRIQVKDSVKEYMIHHIGGVTATQTMAFAYAQGWVVKFPKDLGGYSLSLLETDPHSFHKGDSNTVKNAITLTYLNTKLATKRDTGTWQRQVANNAENGWTLPFYLKSSTVILYNGTPLRPTQWVGLSSTTLFVNLSVKKYDYLVVTN